MQIENESIKHLFFDYIYSRHIRSIAKSKLKIGQFQSIRDIRKLQTEIKKFQLRMYCPRLCHILHVEREKHNAV